MAGKVLVIEDNEQNLYLTRFILEKQGFEVCSAFDGPTGIETARREQPDLVLLDIQLPGMDGYEVAEALSAGVLESSVPIIAVTSYAMPGDREKAIACGCSGYIEKPITPEKFADQVASFLSADREKP